MPETAQHGQNLNARVSEVLAKKGVTPADILGLVADRLRENVGVKLVTVTQRDITDGSFLRLYSSMPDAYAAAGRKPPNDTPWSEHVIEQQQTFVANDYQGLAAVMFDHELILSLGCESIVNVPIVVKGAVIGTLNCLSGPGHFDGQAVEACEGMRHLVALALLLYEVAR
ncbi:GAF domain-containing protein [Pelagibacterium luteolum]|uniref:GAF domain-containing protein n=1 Tax=Pelagibacterium luteolum TaxID=440168 RepID=A0A1G7XGR6_9HYPH|nr:GAF domain-containing protein [Pelagibacterium luteolum]SDG82780.1 GAF domain-containing protein [Pelagibacterium luteolum]